MNYSPEFINLLKDDPHIRRAIQDRNFTYIYEYLNVNIYRSIFTQFFYNELKVNPLDYMDYVPEVFFSHSPIINFTIPDNIKSIKSRAFDKCRSLTTIEIPNSVIDIGEGAFQACTTLTSVMIPDSVKIIGELAFEYCHSLERVEFGENSQLTTIGSFAYHKCQSLRTIEIPEGVVSIGDYAFADCTSLKSITFCENKQVMNIGSNAFYGCNSLTSIIYKGTKKEATKLGIGNRSRTKWRIASPISKIICNDGEIEL